MKIGAFFIFIYDLYITLTFDSLRNIIIITKEERRLR